LSTNPSASTPATAPRKFLFDRPFDPAAVAARPPERKPITLKPEQFDALKQESHDAGFAAGHKAAQDAQDRQMQATLDQIDARLAEMIGALQSMRAQNDAAMRQLALAIVHKILPSLVARSGTDEIESLLATALGDMANEPRLVIRVHDSMTSELEKKIQEIVAQKAYAGTVIVIGESAMAVGDCRIEWADGGVERNAEATLEAATKIVAPEGA